ncbi:MAG: hypothetical protein PEGG_00715 [Paraeggerthella hongkongensis]
METDRVDCEAAEQETDEKASGAGDLADASELLCDAYEIALGASEALRMLYERLQGAYDEESTLIASVLYQITHSLDSARSMIAEADETTSGISRTSKREQ